MVARGRNLLRPPTLPVFATFRPLFAYVTDKVKYVSLWVFFRDFGLLVFNGLALWGEAKTIFAVGVLQ